MALYDKKIDATKADIQALLEFFTRAQDRIVKEIAGSKKLGTVRRRQILRQVDAILEELNDDIQNFTDSTLPKYYAKGFEKLIGHFVDCVLNDQEPITSGRDNLKTLEIAFKAYEASRQQRTLFIGE